MRIIAWMMSALAATTGWVPLARAESTPVRLSILIGNGQSRELGISGEIPVTGGFDVELAVSNGTTQATLTVWPNSESACSQPPPPPSPRIRQRHAIPLSISGPEGARVARGRVYLKEQQLLTTRDKSKRTSSYCAYDDAVSHVRIVGFFETGPQLTFDFDETQAQAQELHDRRIAMRLRDSMNVGYCDAYQKIFNLISDRSRLLPCFTLIYRPF